MYFQRERGDFPALTHLRAWGEGVLQQWHRSPQTRSSGLQHCPSMRTSAHTVSSALPSMGTSAHTVSSALPVHGDVCTHSVLGTALRGDVCTHRMSSALPSVGTSAHTVSSALHSVGTSVLTECPRHCPPGRLHTVSLAQLGLGALALEA